MKTCRIIIILLSITILSACAGSNHAIKKSDKTISGIKEIKKGTSLYNKGCYKRSLEHFLRAHELFVFSDDLRGVAISMNSVGNVYRATDCISSAIQFFDESCRIFLYIKDTEGAVQALSNKSAALIEDDRLEEASNVLSLAESLAKNNKKLSVTLLKNRGILLCRENEFKRAEDILKRALNKVAPANFSEIAAINFALGKLMVETKHHETAVEYFKEALSADQSSGFIKGIADDLAAIGTVYYTQDKYELAVNYLNRSIKIYALIENEDKVNEIMELLNKSSEKAEINISLTKNFVKKWLEGNSFKNLCE
ncbi:MAG: tetratricopeptide repeat protein [Proteobacteria bacterium]|nr:tetratricopeptide repeat protein [Desulfobacteraceae bacterium]MBU3980906.1 tetratricopeptide repeat protein [Pseudomonadota bacterium]MBU4013265.1 tetratricopeptide repeat protein [Pseudomonadota bacterium]MBU4068832.1 tetratricopeptide repeat protein [Pseudomonadota bacterium]MBU4101787.1 tetratricopeptide repeat protein [Pseudomonadota bacterium]